MSRRFIFSLMGFFIFHLFSIGIFAQASFQGLGDLSGGNFWSSAWGISADGSYVVGGSESENGTEAFRWTSGGGMVGLGDLPGGNFLSFSYHVSADGSVVIGSGASVNGREAFRWTSGGGMVGLGDLQGGTFFSEAFDVSDDGSVVVGQGYSASGFEAFRWTSGGGMVGLGALPSTFPSSAGRGVSTDGSVVVGRSAVDNGIEAFRWTSGGGMVGLGDLQNGIFYSEAFDVSADGSVVVGKGESENGTEAFRWTSGDGMVGLGDLPGGGFSSYAYGVSSDGSVVVGYGGGANGLEAFIWTESDGMRSFKDILETDYGLDLTGWILTICYDVSDDGTVMVGLGVNPNGDTEAWRAVLPLSVITNPTPYGKWIAGETDTIKWAETGWLAGNIKCVLNFETPSEDTITIEEEFFLDTTFYSWAIPDTILSYKSKIIIENFFDTTQVIESGIFRIKPYVITRLNSDSTYYAYKIERDKWGFGNNAPDMWPASWYNQFNYLGIDPFTGGVYPNWVGGFVFTFASSADHVDWVTWVNTFTVDACYKSTSLGIYSPTALIRWNAKKGKWNGSCFGIAAANALAFSYKQQFLASYPSFPSFSTPITVPSDTGVKRVVNELFTHQFGNPSLQAGNGRWNVITPNQTLNEIKAMLKEDTVSIRTLSLWNNNGSGGHNILAYGLEQDGTQKELYYVFVYDNAHPNNNNALILIDTTGNSNQGTWLTTYGWTNWGGPKKLMLQIESIKYLTDPVIFPKNNSSSISPFILGEDQLEINSGINSNTAILDMLGNKTGFIDGQVFEEIPESVPLMYLNGSETPPYGYSLQTDDYSVVLNEFEEDTIAVYFFTGNKSFSYKRYGADQTQTDRLFFDGGVSATNPDAQTKSVNLLNIVNETTQEKLFALRSIELAQNDSVKIVNPDDSTLNFISYGSAKDYQVELNFASSTGLGRFVSNDINLTQNSTHQMVPDWSDFEELQLIIYIDEGNNGSIDDTLMLKNQITNVEDQGNLYIPKEYRLEQNYPNPFNPITTIKYSIPTESFVTLKVYNIVGEEVTTLVNEEQSIGNYEVNFNASTLASGIYIYRIQAGDPSAGSGQSFVDTKKMILLK